MASLESALEQAFLKVAQEESQELPAANTIESWLNEQEDVVRKPESIASRSGPPLMCPVPTTARVGKKSPRSLLRIRRLNLIRKNSSTFF